MILTTIFFLIAVTLYLVAGGAIVVLRIDRGEVLSDLDAFLCYLIWPIAAFKIVFDKD